MSSNPNIKESPSLLIHPLRRQIYSILAENPGTYFFNLAKVLELPQGTLNWHLKRLEDANLIKSIKHAGKRVFFPAELRTAEAEKIFTVLHPDTAKKIFIFIVNTPGAFQSQIAQGIDPTVHHDTVRYHINRLEKVDLVRTEREGRKVRIYLGKMAEKIADGSLTAITDSYVHFLMDRLREECLHPEIEHKSKERLILRIECPDGEDIMLSINMGNWDLLNIEEAPKS